MNLETTIQTRNPHILRQRIEEAGLHKGQPWFYIAVSAWGFGLLGVGIYFLLPRTETLWQVLGLAVFMAFAQIQTGFLGHDAGHQQIFSLHKGRQNIRKNNLAGLLVGALVLGMVRTWWVEKHDRHHAHPNQLGKDPDTFVELLAVTNNKKGVFPFVTRYQAYFFWLFLTLEGIGLHVASLLFWKNNKLKYPIFEPVLVLLHVAIYLGLLFFFLPPLHALLFVVVHKMLFGFYLGFVFAPNHKGMRILKEDEHMDFVSRQVLTSRNIGSSNRFIQWILTILYGGLNCQIEHHLFPQMSRGNLLKAQPIVKKFCKEEGLPHHETTVWGSVKEIARYLHAQSAYLRNQ